MENVHIQYTTLVDKITFQCMKEIIDKYSKCYFDKQAWNCETEMVTNYFRNKKNIISDANDLIKNHFYNGY